MFESCGSKLETHQMSNATHVPETYTNIRSPFDDQTVSCKCRATTLSKICSDFVRQIHNKVCLPFVGSTTVSDISRTLQGWISSTCSAQNRAEKNARQTYNNRKRKRRSGKKDRQNPTCSARQTSHIVVQATKNVARYSWSVARRTTFMVWAQLDKTTT